MDHLFKAVPKKRAASPSEPPSPPPQRQRPRTDEASGVMPGHGFESNDEIESSIYTIGAPSTSLSTTAPLAPIEETAIYPFKVKDTYWCPYVLAGLPCSHRKKAGFAVGELKSWKALTQHCDKEHDQGTQILTPVTVCPLQDDIHKIPCPKGCTEMFASYKQANDHAKKSQDHPKGCSMPFPTSLALGPP